MTAVVIKISPQAVPGARLVLRLAAARVQYARELVALMQQKRLAPPVA